MIYELHITVDHTRQDFSIGRWMLDCESWGIKPLDIRLHGGGKHSRQVMFATVHEGDDASAHSWAWGLQANVLRLGYVILRQKLEVPLDKSAPYATPAYHEAHVKSLIPDEQVSYVVGTACDMGWIASWNDLFPRDAGLQKWYFTWRNYSADFKKAGAEFASEFAALAEINWHTVRMESETVISDSNPTLDEGWEL